MEKENVYATYIGNIGNVSLFRRYSEYGTNLLHTWFIWQNDLIE